MINSSIDKILCGVAWAIWVSIMQEFMKLDICEFVGFYEPNDETARKIEMSYSCRRFESLDELGSACDAVSVVCPTDLHAEVAIPLIKKGCNLLVEKPLLHFKLQRLRRFLLRRLNNK